jgi:hypothetical protein
MLSERVGERDELPLIRWQMPGRGEVSGERHGPQPMLRVFAVGLVNWP